MCPSGPGSDPPPPNDEPHAIPEARADLLIHLGALMDAVDVDPRSVEPQAQAVVAGGTRAQGPRAARFEPTAVGGDISGTVGRFVRPPAAGRGRSGSRGGTSVWHVAATVLASRASVLHELGDVGAAAAGPRRGASTAMSRATGVEPDERARFARPGRPLARDRRAARRSARRVRAAVPRAARATGVLEPRSAAIASNNLALVLAERGRVRRGDRTLRTTAVALATAQVPSLLAPLHPEPRLDRGPGRVGCRRGCATSTAPPRPTSTPASRWGSTTRSTRTR